MPQSFINWNQSAHSRPAAVAIPRTIEELVEIVLNDSAYPSPVRAAGHFHSMNACFETTGTQVLMQHFNDMRIDMEAGTITVGAYVKMIQIRDELRRHGMQTEVMPEIGSASAGSVACCGTKDSSLGPAGLGQITSTVVRVKLVNSRGEVEEVSESGDPERMRAVRCSYGLFGIIYEVTFRIQPFVQLHNSYESLRLEPTPSVERIFGEADGVMSFAQPYYRRLIVERRKVVDRGVSTTPFDVLKRKCRERAWENGVSFLTTAIPHNWWFDCFDRLFNWGFLSIDKLGGFHAQRSDTMIDYRPDRSHYFDFTFWAIPLSHWERVIPEYLTFCARFQRETGFRASLPTSIYFVRRDNHSLLSFSPTEDIFTLDPLDSRPNDPLWRRMNRELNTFAAAFGGRPLFNQTKELSREIVHQTLGDEWRRFLAARLLDDPRGRFLNSFFEALM
jgi:hypothetical protein